MKKILWSTINKICVIRKEKKIIQMKYIWFYNVYIIIFKSFIPTKI